MCIAIYYMSYFIQSTKKKEKKELVIIIYL